MPGIPLTGLIISKLGVQATARGDVATGLLCLKVSLPIQAEHDQSGRFPLFPRTSIPRIVDNPSIQALPLTSQKTPSTTTEIAARLLSLTSSYPPQHHASAIHPTIEVSKSTGQLFVVAESRRKSREATKEGRRDWLICLNFEVPITRTGSSHQVRLGLPKCLDNVIRFQIVPPSEGPSDSNEEISMLTEPKVHALPSTAFGEFSHNGQTTEIESEESEGDDEEGCWLEGRFQSTESLRLEWSANSSRPNCHRLTVKPTWGTPPCIDVSFMSAEIDQIGTVPVEAIVPTGWGWAELEITGPGVISWSCLDADLGTMYPGHHDEDEDDSEADDSFSTTVLARRRQITPPRRSPASRPSYASSLLRQPIPAHLAKVEDYSFEVGDASLETVSTATPFGSSRSNPRSTPLRTSAGTMAPSLGQPVDARLFDVSITQPTSIAFVGKLVPLSRLTLVSPSLPLPIPHFRINDNGDEAYLVESPGTDLELQQFGDGLVRSGGTESGLGHLAWSEEARKAFPDVLASVTGDIDVRLVKDVWGFTKAHITFDWPARGKEVEIKVSSPSVRLAKAAIGSMQIPRAVVVKEGEMIIRLGQSGTAKPDARAELVLNMQSSTEIPLPNVAGAGRLMVQLLGNQWDAPNCTVKTNMTPIGPLSWTYDRSQVHPAKLTITPTSQGTTHSSIRRRTRGLLSWSSLINLLLVYIVISLASRVQNLRNEVAFVAEEARDLRLYGFTTILTSVTADTFPTSTAGLDKPSVLTETITDSPDKAAPIMSCGKSLVVKDAMPDIGTSVGRVVFGRSAWDKWSNHPTLGKSLSWVWEKVMWLVIP